VYTKSGGEQSFAVMFLASKGFRIEERKLGVYSSLELVEEFVVN
jgi:hypothetical protein